MMNIDIEFAMNKQKLLGTNDIYHKSNGTIISDSGSTNVVTKINFGK